MLQHCKAECLDSTSAEILSVFYSGAFASRKCRSFWKWGLAVWPLTSRPKLFSHTWDSFKVTCVFGWFLCNDDVHRQRTPAYIISESNVNHVWHMESLEVTTGPFPRTASIPDRGPGRCIVLQLQSLGLLLCCWGRGFLMKRYKEIIRSIRCRKSRGRLCETIRSQAREREREYVLLILTYTACNLLKHILIYSV